MFRQVTTRLGSHFLLLVAATLILSFGVAIAGRIIQLYDLQEEAFLLQEDIATLETRRQEIVALQETAGSEAHTEEIAREQLGWVKPGEIGVVVLGLNLAIEPAESTHMAAAPEPRSSWEQWRDWLARR